MLCDSVFLCRLEAGSGECFVGVTAISNRIQCRLEIVISDADARSEGWWGSEEMAAGCWKRARVCIVLLAPARFRLG